MTASRGAAAAGAWRLALPCAAAAAVLLAWPCGPATAQGVRSVPARAQVTLEAFLGTAVNAPVPLRLAQSGLETIRLTARYRTDALSEPLYYVVRIGSWRGNRGWALELAHHKLLLENEPPEVQRFEISHGYNLLTLNRVWRHGRMRYLLGAGAVVAHPESEVRGRAWPDHGGLFGGGYYVTGPTVQVGAGRELPLPGSLFAAVEGKVTASYARVPIRNGHATAPDAAFHLLAGLGARL